VCVLGVRRYLGEKWDRSEWKSARSSGERILGVSLGMALGYGSGANSFLVYVRIGFNACTFTFTLTCEEVGECVCVCKWEVIGEF